MAYDLEKKQTNADNCTEHRWPRTAIGRSVKSNGTVQFMQCNNCLAMKLVFETDLRIEGKWCRVTQTKVVEPDFDLSTAVPHEDLFKID